MKVCAPFLRDSTRHWQTARRGVAPLVSPATTLLHCIDSVRLSHIVPELSRVEPSSAEPSRVKPSGAECSRAVSRPAYCSCGPGQPACSALIDSFCVQIRCIHPRSFQTYITGSGATLCFCCTPQVPCLPIHATNCTNSKRNFPFLIQLHWLLSLVTSCTFPLI